MSYVAPRQPHRVSNSFAKEELEVLAVALRRTDGFTGNDCDAIAQVVHTALCGGDIRGLVRSDRVRQALTKLERSRESEIVVEDPEARAVVTERVSKMLARAKLLRLELEAAEWTVPA